VLAKGTTVLYSVALRSLFYLGTSLRNIFLKLCSLCFQIVRLFQKLFHYIYSHPNFLSWCINCKHSSPDVLFNLSFGNLILNSENNILAARCPAKNRFPCTVGSVETISFISIVFLLIGIFYAIRRQQKA